MAAAQVYILIPDVRSPGGGVKRLFRYAQYLKEAGIPVSMVKGGREAQVWEQSFGIPMVSGEKLGFTQDSDLLLIPEVFGGSLSALQKIPGRKVMVALSWIYIEPAMPPGTNWKSFGIRDVLTACDTVAEFVFETMALKPVVIPTALSIPETKWDLSLKRNQICYLPGKGEAIRRLATLIQERKKECGLEEWDIVPMSGMSDMDYLNCLLQSKIYLTAAPEEAVPGPVLEALACGCTVVGYGGKSDQEFCVRKAPACGLNVHLCGKGEDEKLIRLIRDRMEKVHPQEQSDAIRSLYSRRQEKEFFLRWFASI